MRLCTALWAGVCIQGACIAGVMDVIRRSGGRAIDPFTDEVLLLIDERGQARILELLDTPLLEVQLPARPGDPATFVPAPFDLGRGDAAEDIIDFVDVSRFAYPIALQFVSLRVRGIPPIRIRVNNEEHLRRLLRGMWQRPDDYDTSLFAGAASRGARRHVWSRAEVTALEGDIVNDDGGCRNRENPQAKMIVAKQRLLLCGEKSNGENCGIDAVRQFLGIRESNVEVRDWLGIPTVVPLAQHQVHAVYERYRVDGDKDMEIIKPQHHKTYIDTTRMNYIVLRDRHYTAVLANTTPWDAVGDKMRTTRGIMCFDFETREEDPNVNMFLKPTICSAVYMPVGTRVLQRRMFTSTLHGPSCARQFLDFLREEDQQQRHYHINAFNGSRFDFYFLYAAMTEEEFRRSDLHLRLLSILKFK